MRRLAPAVLGLLALAGCAGSTGTGADAVVSAGGSAGDGGTGGMEVLQGTVTGVGDAGDRVELQVRLAWAPVLRAENRSLEVHIGAVTRFVPAAARSRLREGDEVQVSVPTGGSPERQAAEIALLDLE